MSSTVLYALIGTNKATPALPVSGLSIEGSQQDLMTSAARAAEMIFLGIYNADEITRVVRLDLSNPVMPTALDVSREVAQHLQSKLDKYLPAEREDREASIAFIENALNVVLDGRAWVPVALAGNWLAQFPASDVRAA